MCFRGVGGTEMSDTKRTDYISWDQYFMGIAMLSAERSKDPNTQVGACIVGEDNRILSVGYNGMPQGCEDDDMPWGRDGSALDSKYMFVCHAELNAILNYRGTGSMKGARVYVTLFPCNECAKAIIQSGITEVVYREDKYIDSESTIASKQMFDRTGVKYRQLLPVARLPGRMGKDEDAADNRNLQSGGDLCSCEADGRKG